MPHAHLKLGEYLQQHAQVSHQEISGLLQQAKANRTLLGQEAVASGKMNFLTLYRTLAQQQQMEFADIVHDGCDKSLFQPALLAEYQRMQLVPVRDEGGVTVFATSHPSAEVAEWLKQHYPQHRLMLTSPLDIRYAISRCAHPELTYKAIHGLLEAEPQFSAKTLFSSLISSQRGVWVLPPLLVLAVSLVMLPPVFIALNLFYMTALLYKTLLLVAGLVAYKKKPQPAPWLDIPEAELPVYTLLIPLFKEQPRVIQNLLDSIGRLNYPQSKLDVKLIVEDTDTATEEAIKAAAPPHHFSIIRVPYSQPQTKPKACNYAMAFAQGKYVTIYDAEDRPEPNQLREAVWHFKQATPDVACVQARLNYFNYNETLLSRMFALEYASWFEFMLPALSAMRLPIPLGGTSNHFPRSILQELYAWDPYNVTEDADLGIRLANKGYRVEILHSRTWEEAPIRLSNWLRQRSRWIKGHLQTFFVHCRPENMQLTPSKLKDTIGTLFFIGAPSLVFLTLPFVLLAAVTLWITETPLPDWFLALAKVLLFCGFLVHVVYAVAGCVRFGWRAMLPYSLLFPFYWLLHSIAAFAAIYQLVTRPFYWEKTSHGETERIQLDNAR